MNHSHIALALLLAGTCLSQAARAEEAEATNPIIVTGDATADRVARPPATRVTTDAARIATTVNAVSVEDTLKYFPSLVVRKRHIGDNFAPIATRTSGLGASARSLIYADGALLSALIANNNGNGSPRWALVTPEEIAGIEVLYGPFSAAYAGNSIGTVVNITTRMPDRLKVRMTVLANVQQFDLYGTHAALPAWQASGSVGDRFGDLAVLLSATRTEANSQPVSFVTTGNAVQPTNFFSGTNPVATLGGFAARSKLGADIRVLGAGGIEHHVQATYKAKFAYDLTSSLRLSYVLGVWTDDTTGDVQSYESDATTGIASYITDNATTKASWNGNTAGFNAAVYSRDALHFSHALNLSGHTPKIDWQVIGTLYDYARDWQSGPSPDTTSGTPANGFVRTRNDLPAAFAGGVGTIQKQDGTGWVTLDAKAALHGGKNDAQVISFGAHADRETLNAATYTIANWLDAASALGQVRTGSHGQTRTLALWAQDAWKLAPAVTLTIGGREEWWRAWNGSNTAYTATVDQTIAQPERRFSAFSPKASLEWRPADGYAVRLSAGQAWRFPTVGELYQASIIGTQFFNPNAALLPERARSLELAVERRDSHGSVRLSLFNEVIRDAMISQTSNVTLPDSTVAAVANIQNVERTRARGVELALDRRDLIPGIDLSASLTYADAITSKDTAFQAAVGKLLPSVPHWKGNAVLSWHATRQITLTSAVRFTSRNYANLDNSDTVGNTYQGFYKYAVVDLRAQFKPTGNFTFSLGVDNVNNNKYFLFHPFPQRSFTAQVDWKL